MRARSPPVPHPAALQAADVFYRQWAYHRDLPISCPRCYGVHCSSWRSPGWAGFCWHPRLPSPGSWVLAALLFLLTWAITQQIPFPVAAFALAGAVVCLAAGVSTWQMRPPAAATATALPAGSMQIRGYPLAPPTTTLDGWHVTFHTVSCFEDQRWRRCDCDIYLIGRPASLPVLGHLHQVLGKSLPRRARQSLWAVLAGLLACQ